MNPYPTKKELARYEAAALSWCNKLRKKKGLKPLKRLPKGKKGNAKSCPCAETTGTIVGPTLWWWYGSNESHILPKGVGHFVLYFDRGLYPHLIEDTH